MKISPMVGLGLLMMCAASQVEAVPTASTLQIGPGYGTACATGCGEHPTVLPNGGGLDIYQNSGGAGPLTDLLLILAVPNVNNPTLFNSAAISSVLWYTNPADPSGDVGSATFSGYQGSLTSGDVYTSLGLTGNNSNRFVNFAATESNLGIPATSFGLYTFSLSGGSLGPKGLVDVDFAGSGLPFGTLALAWGANADRGFATPYTEAGVVGTPVPDPSTLLLLGSGLVGLGGVVWWRHRRG